VCRFYKCFCAKKKKKKKIERRIFSSSFARKKKKRERKKTSLSSLISFSLSRFNKTTPTTQKNAQQKHTHAKKESLSIRVVVLESHLIITGGGGEEEEGERRRRTTTTTACVCYGIDDDERVFLRAFLLRELFFVSSLGVFFFM
jgi:hypothetical protein